MAADPTRLISEDENEGENHQSAAEEDYGIDNDEQRNHQQQQQQQQLQDSTTIKTTTITAKGNSDFSAATKSHHRGTQERQLLKTSTKKRKRQQQHSGSSQNSLLILITITSVSSGFIPIGPFMMPFLTADSSNNSPIQQQPKMNRDYNTSSSMIKTTAAMLTGKNFTIEQINAQIYPLHSYSYLAFVIPILLISDFVRHKPLIIFGAIAHIIELSLTIWGTSLLAMQLMEICLSLLSATRLSFFSYILAKMNRRNYKRATSWALIGGLLGGFLSQLLAQVLISFQVTGYIELVYISLANAILYFLLSSALPSISSSPNKSTAVSTNSTKIQPNSTATTKTTITDDDDDDDETTTLSHISAKSLPNDTGRVEESEKEEEEEMERVFEMTPSKSYLRASIMESSDAETVVVNCLAFESNNAEEKEPAENRTALSAARNGRKEPKNHRLLPKNGHQAEMIPLDPSSDCNRTNYSAEQPAGSSKSSFTDFASPKSKQQQVKGMTSLRIFGMDKEVRLDKLGLGRCFRVFFHRFCRNFRCVPVLKWSVWMASWHCLRIFMAIYIQSFWMIWQDRDGAEQSAAQTLPNATTNNNNREDSSDNTGVYNGLFSGLALLLAMLGTYVAKLGTMNWSLAGEVVLGILLLFNGALLWCTMAVDNVWLAYAAWPIMQFVFGIVGTIARYVLGAEIKDNAFGLVFGLNKVVSLSANSLIIFIVFTAGDSNILNAFTIIVIFHVVIGSLMILSGLIHITRQQHGGSRDFFKDPNLAPTPNNINGP